MLRYPASSTALLGSSVLWAWSAQWHHRLAEALWAHMLSPMPVRWLSWEMGPGIVNALGRWVSNGLFLLTIPALVDHSLVAVRTGPPTTRICEFILLCDNIHRLVVTLTFEKVRTSMQSEAGNRAMQQVEEVVHDVLDRAGDAGDPPRKVVTQLLGGYYGFFWCGVLKIGGLKLDVKDPQLQKLRLFFPQQFFVCLQLLAAQLGSRSMRQCFLPLVWQYANRDVGRLARTVDFLSAFAKMGVNANQRTGVLGCCCNLRDLLCSVMRGARAVQTLTLYLT